MLKKIILVIANFLAITSYGQEIKHVIVFGDSLSDKGNYFLASASSPNPMPLAPYFKGRATNGPVWVEYFVKSINATLVDNAYLGALTSGSNPRYPNAIDLVTQVNNYLKVMKEGKFDASKTLFVVWAGANNIFTMDFNSPWQTLKSLWRVSSDIKKSVNLLRENGAQNILVANLPDLGKIALNKEIEDFKKMSFFLSFVSRAENFSIKTRILSITEKNKDNNFKLIFFDAEQMLTHVKENPAFYHIKNTENACYIGVPSNPPNPNISCANPNDYLFWDLVHPSTKIHCYASYEIQKKLSEEHLTKLPTRGDLLKCSQL